MRWGGDSPSPLPFPPPQTTTEGRVICLTQSTDSNVNLIQKYPQGHTRIMFNQTPGHPITQFSWHKTNHHTIQPGSHSSDHLWGVFKIYWFERERRCARESGGRGRGKELQADSPQSVSPMVWEGGINLLTMRSWPQPKSSQMLNWLAHPGAPRSPLCFKTIFPKNEVNFLMTSEYLKMLGCFRCG